MLCSLGIGRLLGVELADLTVECWAVSVCGACRFDCGMLRSFRVWRQIDLRKEGVLGSAWRQEEDER